MLHIRKHLALTVSTIATALVIAQPALAADTPAAPAADAQAPEISEKLNEIVVTAQKRPENLQKVPIAISSLSGAALQERHAQSLLDLGDGAIPSLRVDPFFSRPSPQNSHDRVLHPKI